MDYEQSVDLIKGVEGEDPSARSVVVSLVESDDKVDIKEYSEKEVGQLVNFVEKVTGSLIAGGAAQPGTGTAQAGTQEVAVQRNPDIRIPEAPEMKIERKKANKVFQDAGKELEKAVAGVENTISNVSEKNSGEKLILVNLSISDQINELEKISLGLDGNVFTPEQRKIIITEVSGLYRRKPKPVGDFQKEAAAIRDKRLKEVMDKLGLK